MDKSAAKELTKYLFKHAGMVFLIDLVFAVLGLVGLILPDQTGWQIVRIIFGIVMIASYLLIQGFFAYSEAYHGALFISGKKKNLTGEHARAKEFAVWKGFLIPAIAESLPLLMLLIGIGVPGLGRGFLGFWFSGFASLCVACGCDILKSGMFFLLHLIMIAAVIGAFAFGYLLGGWKKKKLHHELEVDAQSYLL